jgi:hypothetical protein
MAGKFARSWELVKASAAVLNSDRKLLLFPLLSGIATLVVLASFALPVMIALGVFHGGLQRLDHGMQMDAAGYAIVFMFYLVQYTVIFFFNTALVGAAMMRLEGGTPTLGDGLRLAWSKWPQIFGYAAIAATVGMLLRAAQERLGLIGRWVVGLIGLGWTVATFLVVPVLAATDVGPIDAVKRSAALLKRSWGENIIGNVGFGVVFGVASLLLFAVLGGLFTLAAMAQSVVLVVAVVAIAVLCFVLLALVQSALQGVYAAALYRYAEFGDAGAGFHPALLEQAFRPKR